MRTGPDVRAASPTAELADRLRAGPAGRLLGPLASSWALGGLVVVVSAPPFPAIPTPGLDASWVLALQMAAVERLHWGTELIFGYGPLGFLRGPLVANTWPAVLGGVYLFAIRLALAVSIVWIARRRFNLPIALAIAFVTVSLSATNAAVPLAFIWCAYAIAEDPPTRYRRLVLFGGAALSALEVLVKLNEGLMITGMCAVAALTMGGRRSRNLLSFGLTFVACFLTFWFAAGQGIANLGEFVAGSVEVFRGYSSAMVFGSTKWPAVALTIWALAVLAALSAGRGLPFPRRLGLVLLVLGLGFGAWKEGFVRQGPGHLALFFAWMLAPWIAFRWRQRYPWALAGFACVAILYFATTGFRPRLQLVENARTTVTRLRTIFEPARRSSVRTRVLMNMQSAYGLDQPTLELLQGKTVHMWPWEAGIVWAYGLNWKPLPMFQAYGAYTSWLDERNAAALASSEGPQRILRHQPHPGEIGGPLSSVQPTSINRRYAAYDSPAATLAMLCHFEALRTTPRYQALGRTRDRCGPPRLLSSISAGYGQDVEVPKPPRPHDVVFVRIYGAAPSGIEAVRTFVYRAAGREVVFNGRILYRVVPGVLGDGLILDASPGTDFPRPFGLAPNPHTVGLRKDPAPLSPDHELRFDFFAMRVRPK